MKKIIISIIIIVIASIIAFIFWRNSPEQREKRKMMHGISIMRGHVNELIKRSKSGKFSIEGKIVDEKGNPLNNVRINITRSISRGFMGNKHTNRKKIVDEKFSLNESGCNVLHLQFLKQGYFSANKSYNIKMKPKGNISVKGSLLIATKQIIVLREIGKLANLKSRYGKFYLDIVSKEQDIMNLITFKKIKIKSLKDVKTPKYFYLSVKLDKHGKPEMILDRQKKLIPKKIFLNYISNDKTDGIIPVADADVKDMRDMPVAPAKDYNLKKIPLKISHAGDFFYYKNGNTYGKVWIKQTSFIGNRVKSVMIIKQNNDKDPNEKRNLRSMKR